MAEGGHPVPLTESGALFYTRSLRDLPEVSYTDVYRLASENSRTPDSKLNKGMKFSSGKYYFNVEGEFLQQMSDTILSNQ